jgi:two-component system phosphate regulon response regulator OmpR
MLILLDAGLPDGDGLLFCKQLAQEEPNIPIILLTARNALIDKLNGLKFGADDYIVKPFDYNELVERIKVVLRRTSRMQSHLVQSELQVGDLELNTAELKVSIAGQQVIQLTHTEMKILRCLMLNVGSVLSRGQIAELALGYDYENASNIVDVYMLRLRKKLEIMPSKPKYFETIIGSGYRMLKPGKAKVEEKALVAREVVGSTKVL